MSIGRIGSEVPKTFFPKLNEADANVTSSQGTSFGEALSKALAEVNQAQLTADESATALATGQAASLQQVVLETEKANLALQFTMAVRNKILDAYNEIMRMPV